MCFYTRNQLMTVCLECYINDFQCAEQKQFFSTAQQYISRQKKDRKILHT